MSVTGNMISKLKRGYNLNYFNLWWSRMEVESRNESKETKREEEEARRNERKRKFSNNMGWDTQRGRISTVDVSGTDRLTCSLGVGDEQYPGVTVEGEGVVVPKTVYVINEQFQASMKLMTQHLDGTRVLEEGSELGSVAAEVEDAKAIRRKGK